MSNPTFESVTKTISLDFAQRTSVVTAFAKQGDENTRFIHIQPLLNGVPYGVETNARYEARFAAKKPDGKFVYNDSVTIEDDGTLIVTLTDQTLAAHGNAECCVMLVDDANNKTLTSQNFTLIIEYSAGAYKNLASSDEILGLDEKLEQAQALIDKLKNELFPEPTEQDAGKSLTANADGTLSWEMLIPERTAADAGKVLTANEDGSMRWDFSNGGRLLVVDVPATGSAELGNWSDTTVQGKYTYTTLQELPANSTIIPSDLTDHGLTVTYDEQGEQWVLQLDSLPDNAVTLKLLFVPCEGIDGPQLLPIGGGDGGTSVTEVTSPDEITKDSPDGFYFVEGDESGSTGGTAIHYYDSLDAAAAANLPDGSFVAVPSEEKVFDLTAMGFPVVAEIGQTYTLTTDTTEIYNAFLNGSVNFSFDFMAADNKVIVHTGSTIVPSIGVVLGSTIVNQEGAWVVAYIGVTDSVITIVTKVLA